MRSAERQTGIPANPLNLIRFVPAEGLDASAIRRPIPFNRNLEGGAACARLMYLPSLSQALALSAALCGIRRQRSPSTPMKASPPNGARARRSKKAFESRMRLRRSISSRSPTASRCSTASKLEGSTTKADIVLGLDTNLTAEAKATGLFAPHGVDTAGLTVPGGWTRRHFRALRLWLFRRRLRHRQASRPRRRA